MNQNKHRDRGAPQREATGHLRIMEPAKRSASVERLRRRYDRHLDQVAGLTEATREVYWLFIRQFLQWRFGRRAPELRVLNAQDMNRFIRFRALHLQCSSLHVLAAALRSFLEFLHFTRRAHADLRGAVMCPAPRPQSSVPDTLSAAEVRRLLNSFDRSQPLGKRNFAMALCLCRVGMRAKEVASLQLEDVDWEARTLHLRHTKTRRSRLIPLPTDVAAALRDYLRAGRPPTDCPALFVRHRAPFGAGRRSGLVRAAIRGAGLRAGLSHQGVHILRHTLATRLHRRGAPLKTIADLLGHLSLNTTARYARTNLSELRQAALPWPQ